MDLLKVKAIIWCWHCTQQGLNRRKIERKIGMFISLYFLFASVFLCHKKTTKPHTRIIKYIPNSWNDIMRVSSNTKIFAFYPSRLCLASLLIRYFRISTLLYFKNCVRKLTCCLYRQTRQQVCLGWDRTIGILLLVVLVFSLPHNSCFEYKRPW